MSASAYPRGFDAVTIRGVPITQAQPGKVFWVGNAAASILAGHKGASDGNKGTFEAPFSTIDYAIGQCTAGRNDVILVKPGHAETISAANGILADISGVAIVGLGAGASRPTITLDTATTTTIGVTAANVTFKNCIFTANFADIVSFFTLTTAKNFGLEDCYFKATATNMNCLYVVDTNATTADADGLSITNCKWIEPDTATESMIKMDGTNADVRLENNYVVLGVGNNKPCLATVATGKVITAGYVVGNRVYRLNTDTATGAILIHSDGTNTGIVANNFAQHADTAAELLVTATSGWGCFNNYASGVAAASGYPLPAADS